MNKYLKQILEKMCDVVGANFNSINFSKHGWFLEYSWTEEQEKEFRDWMVKYLINNKNARKDLLVSPVLKKKIIGVAVDEFIWNYGWKGDI